jgi:site-specific recombinase XerD
VLTAIDRTAADGRRDYALLATMFNTGARVQEIVAVRVLDVRLQSPPHVRLFGKGRKERVCPFWPQTAEILRALLAERGDRQLPEDPLFRNHRGSRLTRFGIRYILRKHCARAQAARPALAGKRLHPTA